MSIASRLRPGRKGKPSRDGNPDTRSVTEAIAAVPAMEWPVPAAQRAAERAASGPQQALPASVPPAPAPAQPVPQDHPRGTHPYPSGPQPAFTGYPAYASGAQPAPQRPAQRPSGMQHTQAWTAPFAEAGERPRPYAPGSQPPVFHSEAEREAAESLTWAQHARGPAAARVASHHPLPPPEPALFTGPRSQARQQAAMLRYPPCDISASRGAYTALFRRLDEITGTRGTAWAESWRAGTTPCGKLMQALPAADGRWQRLAGIVAGHVQAFADTDPAKAGAYRRLHEAVLAAPDYGTAARLAALADEAGIAGYLDLPKMASPAQDGEAAA